VGGVPARYLVHLLADGRLDPAFAPDLNGSVRALVLMDGTLYVGGGFQRVNGQQRIGAAALTLAGTLRAWNPNFNNGVFALAAGEGVLYVGGPFDTVGGMLRPHAAAIDAEGNVLSWNPASDSSVLTLAYADDRVYLGGSFTTVAGQLRACLAAVGVDGVLQPWDPTIADCPAGAVTALALDDGVVYVGGRFRRAGAAALPRDFLAAFDLAGAILPWAPGTDGGVEALSLAPAAAGMPARVLIGGRFNVLDGEPRMNLGAVDAQGHVLAWAPEPIDRVNALATQGAAVCAGGDFTAVQGRRRRGLAALDAQGALTDWGADVAGQVLTLAILGDTLYLGGQFSSVAGLPRSNAAAVGTDGALRTWTADTAGTVNAIAVGASRIYLGGLFSSVNGQPRQNLAVMLPDGGLVGWSPAVGGEVTALLARDPTPLGDRLYLAGHFSTLSGLPRNQLGAYNDLGQLLAWDPNQGYRMADTWTIHALEGEGAEIYVGGNFAAIFNVGRTGLAVLDANNGALLPWTLRADNTVYTLRLEGDRLYAGGAFGKLSDGEGQQFDRRGAAVIGADGVPAPWNPELDGAVYTIDLVGDRLLLAGEFKQAQGNRAAGNVETVPIP